jgi:5-methylcytosine-specific restriction endonuclease McrA
MSPPKDPEKYKLWVGRQRISHLGKHTGRAGKKFTEIFGEEKARNIGKKISASRVGKTYEEIYGERAVEMSNNMSQSKKGKPSPFKGKTLIQICGSEERAFDTITRRRATFKKKLEENPNLLKGFTMPPRTEEHRKNNRNAIRRFGDLVRKEDSREDFRGKEWKKEVNKRDNYTCFRCKKADLKGLDLHTHHIKSWEQFPELRFDPLNGITLCRNCHAIAEHLLKKLIFNYVKDQGMLEIVCDEAFRKLSKIAEAEV